MSSFRSRNGLQFWKINSLHFVLSYDTWNWNLCAWRHYWERSKSFQEKPKLATEKFSVRRQTCYSPPVVHSWIFTLEDKSLFIFHHSCYYNNFIVHLHLTRFRFCFEIIVRDKIHASKIHAAIFYLFVSWRCFFCTF